MPVNGAISRFTKAAHWGGMWPAMTHCVGPPSTTSAQFWSNIRVDVSCLLGMLHHFFIT